MPVSDKLKRIVWVKAGGACSICREHLLADDSAQLDIHLLGEVAHIVAEQKDGPRGNSQLSLKERNSEPNLLLLCFRHHKIVDDDPITYPVDHLQKIKANHIAWVASMLHKEHPWRTKLHNFYYINVPRLNILAAVSGYSLDLSRYGEIIALHELGWNLNSLMLDFKDLLSQVELKSVDLATALTMKDSARGLLVNFDQSFRTKNIHMPETTDGYKTAIKGNLKNDPHIYTDLNDYRVVITIDPRWITTTTAFVQFRPSSGKNKFAGLGIFNSCDDDTKLVSITPLVIGLPSNPFLEAFYGSL